MHDMLSKAGKGNSINTNYQFWRHKLTTTKILLIKNKLFNPNRKTRLKMIARQFGVSAMTLHRIKTGENWGQIKLHKQQYGTK